MVAEGENRFPHEIYARHVLKPYFRDAKRLYYEPMLAANEAHVVMLLQQGIISRENARSLLAAIADVRAAGVDAFHYEAGVEDLFFAIENRLIELAGPAHGGNLHLARSRNDLGYALTRLALRRALLDVATALLAFRRELLAFARRHLSTLMPGYTHTQPAQPTTMAHYVAGLLGSLERDAERLHRAYEVNNASPLGAAAFTGTGFPIDRALVADLLGFGSVIESTYDAIAASDNLTDAANALTSLGINLSRFTRDLLFWATQESGAIRIDDSFIQVSSIMPQKRNPVVLEHIRARISRMLGQADTIVVQCHGIPLGDTQDIEDEMLPSLFGATQSAVEVLELYRAVIETLQVSDAHLAARARESFISVTELADTLVREEGLAFRQAHRVVSALVELALAEGIATAEITPRLLAQASQETIGRTIAMSEAELERALDPWAFVEKRNHLGGAAPAATAEVLSAQDEHVADTSHWLRGEMERLADARHRLKSKVSKVVQG
jgi:argininosuccinate lyase